MLRSLVGSEMCIRDSYQDESRRRVHLPTYPFERKRFWFDEDPEVVASASNGHATNGAQPNGSQPNGTLPAHVAEAGYQNGHSPAHVATMPQTALNTEQRQLIEQQLHVMALQLQAWRNLLND